MKVYHGSYLNFDIAKPSRTGRGYLNKEGEFVRTYEGISLHSTPYKWIALSYMKNKRAKFIDKGKVKYFSAAVPVARKDKNFNNKEITIYGKKSLEYSLEKIFGKGGYLYTFDGKNFKHIKGLGENEVASYEEQKPEKKQFIKNPVEMMKKEGVRFVFEDLTKSE